MMKMVCIKYPESQVQLPRSPLHSRSLAALQLKADLDDLDTPDELALRALLLGIHHRTLKAFDVARGFLVEAHGYQSELKVSSWIGSLSMFELAVLDLKETEDRDGKRVMQSTEKGYGNSADEDGCNSQSMGDEEDLEQCLEGSVRQVG